MAVGIAIAAFLGILILVSIVVVVILATMGNQIANVFSNVAAALTANPSP
jgi:Flp pilus assembly pilin Flp